MKKPNYFKKSILILQELKKSHPSTSFGKHIAIAFDEYDLFSITDKLFSEILEEYSSTLELETHDNKDDEIQKIISDGMKLNSLFIDEDNDYYEC